jgi:hypothetical protein
MKEGELEDRNNFQELDIGRDEGQEMALDFYLAEVERGDKDPTTFEISFTGI